MSIITKCPNGHQLQWKDRYAGLVARCPKCNASVTIPKMQKVASSSGETREDSKISEDAIADLLSDVDAGESRTSVSYHAEHHHAHDQPMHLCPKCNSAVPVTIKICPFCRTYFSELTPAKPIHAKQCPECGTACSPQESSCSVCGRKLF